MSVGSVLSSPSKVQVLRVLSNSSSAYSPQELESETTRNISVIYDAVRELEDEGVIVSVKAEGKKNYYRLNENNPVAGQVKQLFKAEREDYGLEELPAHLINTVMDARNRLIDKVGGLELVLLFGSVSRGDFTPESDIDLYIVLEDKSTGKEDRIYDILENYGKEFSVVLRDRKEYEKEFDDEKSELANSIVLEGFKILYSSSDELENVVRKGMGLEHLAVKDLREEEKIEKLKNFLAEYEVDDG